MSYSLLAPLAVALSALVAAPGFAAEPTAPLFVVEQQRAALVAQLSRQWSGAFAALPAPRQRTQEQLASTLWSLRADRLFAVSLAGEVEDVEAVFADANRELPRSERPSRRSAIQRGSRLHAAQSLPHSRHAQRRRSAAGERRAHIRRLFDELRYAGRHGDELCRAE